MAEAASGVSNARKAASATLPRIVNNFLHDTCTGTWVGALIVIWTLWAQAGGMPREAAAALSLAATRVWWLLLLALVGLGVTGGIRLRYWRAQATPEELVEKRRALIWKHVAFILVYGAGTLWAWWMIGVLGAAVR
jgi:hypothetical protein